VFFVAEMGDKTQLATVVLGARFHSATMVTRGNHARHAGRRRPRRLRREPAHQRRFDEAFALVAAALSFAFVVAAVAGAVGSR
jgi:putative Ca2+/H+ antiporter (TMEM165/GDT1 family)